MQISLSRGLTAELCITGGRSQPTVGQADDTAQATLRGLPNRSRRPFREVVLSSILGLVVLQLPFSTGAQVAKEELLHSFAGAATLDGAFADSTLIQATDGALYGTTWGGGNLAGGTIFRLHTDGTGYAILHHFGFAPDASAPFSSLIQGSDGALYGTTYWGGVSNSGTVFRIGTDGISYQVLHNFSGAPDGSNPWAGLVQGRDGLFYGTTWGGGSDNAGTVFRINTNGAEYQVLHNFVHDFQDGSTPYAGLLQGQDGAFYGTTDSGGSSLGGTVFRMSPEGSSYQILHEFEYNSGCWPRGGLVQGSDGILYGTTYSGGPQDAGGVVYRVGTNGLGYAMLHSLPSGANSQCTLIQSSDGMLYGTTEWGGNTNGGTVFRLRTDGSDYLVLHHFGWNSSTDGNHPVNGLMGRNGVFYGTTESGGLFGFGSVYRISFPLAVTIAHSAQGPRLTISGSPGQACRLETTTNCTDWTPRMRLILINGAAEFIETDSASARVRLYKVVAE